MRLKYFLRGLGIGIVVTTIILAISSFSLLDDLHPANYIFLLIYVHANVIVPIRYPTNHTTLHVTFFLFPSFLISSLFPLFIMLCSLVKVLHHLAVIKSFLMSRNAFMSSRI